MQRVYTIAQLSAWTFRQHWRRNNPCLVAARIFQGQIHEKISKKCKTTIWKRHPAICTRLDSASEADFWSITLHCPVEVIAVHSTFIRESVKVARVSPRPPARALRSRAREIGACVFSQCQETGFIYLGETARRQKASRKSRTTPWKYVISRMVRDVEEWVGWCCRPC